MTLAGRLGPSEECISPTEPEKEEESCVIILQPYADAERASFAFLLKVKVGTCDPGNGSTAMLPTVVR